jgi:hypothetical protein
MWIKEKNFYPELADYLRIRDAEILRMSQAAMQKGDSIVSYQNIKNKWSPWL